MKQTQSQSSRYVNLRVLRENPEFLCTFLSFLTWAACVGATFFLIDKFSVIGQSLVPLLLIVISTWAYRSRHNFGMRRNKAHFDEIDLLQLPPKSGLKWDCCGEPPTPIEPNVQELQYLGVDAETVNFVKSLTKALDEKGGATPAQRISFEQKRQSHYDNMFTYAMEQQKLLSQRKTQGPKTATGESESVLMIDTIKKDDEENLQSAKEIDESDFVKVNKKE